MSSAASAAVFYAFFLLSTALRLRRALRFTAPVPRWVVVVSVFGMLCAFVGWTVCVAGVADAVAVPASPSRSS